MIEELEIPSEVPVMTLSGVVLFPQAIMPLHIFEPRYRQMLREVLAGDRIFAVAALDDASTTPGLAEPAHAVAGVGMIRACRTTADGRSNLILQGLARVELEHITAVPFRKARIHQRLSTPGGPRNACSERAYRPSSSNTSGRSRSSAHPSRPRARCCSFSKRSATENRAGFVRFTPSAHPAS